MIKCHSSPLGAGVRPPAPRQRGPEGGRQVGEGEEVLENTALRLVRRSVLIIIISFFVVVVTPFPGSVGGQREER